MNAAPTDVGSTFYNRLLFAFKTAPAFMPLAMVSLGVLTRQGYGDARFYSTDYIFMSIVGIYAIISLMFFLYKKHGTLRSRLTDAAFLCAFHALTLLFTLLVSGFLSAFLAVWIILIVSSDIRFGLKGSLLSFAGLCLTAALSALWHAQLTAGEHVEILQGALVVGALGFVLARVLALTNRERTVLARTRNEEINQRERLIALVNSMGDAVIATDDHGSIKVYNSSLLSLLDTNLDLSNKQIDPVLELIDKNGRPVSILQDAKQRRSVYSRTDLSHKFADGQVIKLYINVAPIQPGYQSRAERGYIIILRDITKEKTLEEERDEFVSVVSHELRTPVTIAEGNLSNIALLLERNTEKAPLQKAVTDAHDQILYLAKLVNDLGTLARAERGSAGQIEQVDLMGMLHDMYTTYAPQAQAKKLQFNLDAAPLVPTIRTNPLYLQEILQNLITNAIKYTRTGTITLKSAATKKEVVVEVIDTGIGIGKSDQAHVFEKFYRSEDYRTRESSGTGLGLYVCKKLAEKLGLSLTFTSRLNHGSTFRLVLPVGKPRTADPGLAPGSTRSDPSR